MIGVHAEWRTKADQDLTAQDIAEMRQAALQGEAMQSKLRGARSKYLQLAELSHVNVGVRCGSVIDDLDEILRTGPMPLQHAS